MELACSEPSGGGARARIAEQKTMQKTRTISIFVDYITNKQASVGQESEGAALGNDRRDPKGDRLRGEAHHRVLHELEFLGIV